jgi:hypothetical protein
MRSLTRGLGLVFAAAVLAVGLPSVAEAGTYQVHACTGNHINNSWKTERAGFVDAYVDCVGEGIVARTVVGPGRAAEFSYARAYFEPPPSTRIIGIQGLVQRTALNGWESGIFDRGMQRWAWCGGVSSGCPNTVADGRWDPLLIGGLSTTRIEAMAMCGPFNCPRDQWWGRIALQDVLVTIADEGGPTTSIVGGSLMDGNWHNGTATLAVNARDPVGIKAVSAWHGQTRVALMTHPCDYTKQVPCTDGQDNLPIDTSLLTDGHHTIDVRAVDTADNTALVSREIAVDNTAPLRPVGLTVGGGEGWSARNGFRIAWRNPDQNGLAPINVVSYKLCPASSGPDDDSPDCVGDSRSGADLNVIGDLEVPGQGSWRARFWLRDAAGNADENKAQVVFLRYDSEPPILRFFEANPDDPTRIRVRAEDSVSGVAGGAVEVRRHGEAIWRSLPVEMDRSGFSAVVNDEDLPDGIYDVRARTVDNAGNERSTDRVASGAPASLTLPIRMTTHLAVGKVKRVRAKGARGRYRRVLVAHPWSRFGRTIPLHGRLTSPGGNPLPDRDVEVYERVNLSSSPWRRIATIRTSRTGTFVFRALQGPSRLVRFRYPGTATIRGIMSEVELRVKAATSMRSSRRSVVNGEEVTFRGRLRGGPFPATSKLIQLQAFARGHWLTFATPRANSHTGLWSLRYRFAATRGRVRYRFRARVPKEASYPYESGVSKRVAVTVQGL